MTSVRYGAARREGTWRGQRTRVCEDQSRLWIRVLKMVGHGSGGALAHKHLEGVETSTTFTPIPAPYELIPGFCPADVACPPEGVLTGKIWSTGRPHEFRGARNRPR